MIIKKYKIILGRDLGFYTNQFNCMRLYSKVARQQTERVMKDHREINQTQMIFMQHPSSPGTPYILPHGQRIIDRITRVLQTRYKQNGYQIVNTPVMLHADLWKTSGHWDQYKDDMYFIQQQDNSSDYGLKPMNCPSHCIIYQSQYRTFKELPLKLADFSPLHRNEASGALTGLTRVRQFHQDDAHIFCRQDQVKEMISETITMIQWFYKDIMKFQNYQVALSTRPEHYIGNVQQWDQAESILSDVLIENFGKSWQMNQGDGAFYGPKLDFSVKDFNQKLHQLGTIQLDFQLPQKFDLKYTNSNDENEQPVLIHRAVCGSLERFLAIYMEHTQGKWPFWCNPRQIMIIPFYKDQSQKSMILDYVKHLKKDLEPIFPEYSLSDYYYIDTDFSDEWLQKKIATAHDLSYNYTIVVGPKEVETGLLAVRNRDTGKTVNLSILDFKKEMFTKMNTFQQS